MMNTKNKKLLYFAAGIFLILLAAVAVTLCCCKKKESKSVSLSFPTDLEYDFLPAQKMEFINGIVRNRDAKALPDIDAQYSKTVKVNGTVFTLPGELCETMSACYKADFNRDGVADYAFVNVKVWNGRYFGLSDVGVFVSNPQKEYTFHAFEARYLDAEKINNSVMLVKYAYSDDQRTFIRQYYTFTANGDISLHKAEKCP